MIPALRRSRRPRLLVIDAVFDVINRSEKQLTERSRNVAFKLGFKAQTAQHTFRNWGDNACASCQSIVYEKGAEWAHSDLQP